MAITVRCGGEDEFRALVYGEKNPGTLSYLQNQVSNLSSMLSDAGKSFYANSQQLFNSFNGSEALMAARAAVRRASSLLQKDCIRPLNDLGAIQNAPLSMQRYIMAQPYIRELYLAQSCDGYSSSYVDVHNKAIGDAHYDYRRVVNGIVQLQEDGSTVTVNYIDDELLPEDRELDIVEQSIVMDTWAAIEHYARTGERDPTSMWNSKL